MERFSFRSQLPYSIGNVDFMEMHYSDRTASFLSGRVHSALIYTARGRMIYHFGDAPTEVPSGEAIFIPAGTKYTSTYPEEGATAVLVSFDVTEGRLPPCFEAPCVLGKCGMERELEELRGYIPHAPIRVFCTVYGLIERLARAREEFPALYAKILPAVYEIERNYADECRVADLAALCCMSESGLRRLFREYVGMSPLEYRNALRLGRARQLLCDGEYGVAEAAEHVGFSNLSFFYRLYKRRFGCCPGEEKKG